MESYLHQLTETTVYHKVLFQIFFAKLEYIPLHIGEAFKLIRHEPSEIQQVVERQPLFSWSQK